MMDKENKRRLKAIHQFQRNTHATIELLTPKIDMLLRISEADG